MKIARERLREDNSAMTFGKAICASVFMLGALASAPADAHRGVRFGFHFGFPIFLPYYYYYYSPPPPVYYHPPPVVHVPAPSPPAYVERSVAPAAPPPEAYWYYCADSEAYYPYVRQCATEWQRVSPRPPGM
jgi:hypothetical protein